MAKPTRALHCAAVDLGATSGRVILGTWQDERLTLREVYRFPNAFHTLNGHDYWEVGRLWHDIQSGLAAAAQAVPAGATLASVGVDTWGVDYALLDARGRLVFPVHAHRDARTRPGLAALARNQRALARLYAATGVPNVFYNSSLQLAETLASCPGMRRVVSRCLFLPDYFNFLLSGRMENEVSIASTSQLLSVAREPAWSGPALRHFGVPASWFSAPIAGQTRLGRVRGLAGLARAEVIAVPGHDTACAYDAMPAAPGDGSLYISAGTWSLVGFESEQPVLGAAALAARISNERTATGGYRPLKNVIGLWLLEGLLKDFGTRPADDRAWEKLLAAAAAEAPPPAPLDLSDPGLFNPSSMRAAVDAQLGKRRLARPATLAGYVRLACASIGEGHALAVRQFATLARRQFRRIVIVGGGARNRLVCQATADAAGLPVLACELEGTATGNLARQLLAWHAVKDLAAFRARFAPTISSRTYLPRHA